jgi:hypothetical protein
LSGNDGNDDEDDDDLPPQWNLFDNTEPIVDNTEPNTETIVDSSLSLKKNTHISNRSYSLFGNSITLVAGKEQLLEVDGTTTHYSYTVLGRYLVRSTNTFTVTVTTNYRSSTEQER